MIRTILRCLLILIALNDVVIASTIEDKCSNYTIKQLSTAQECGATDFDKKDLDRLEKELYLVSLISLNILMYPAVSDFEGSVKAFQRDIGEKSTGELTMAQLNKLNDRASGYVMNFIHISFPHPYSNKILNNSAFVEGTVVMYDDKIAWPINYETIECNKHTMLCSVDSVSLGSLLSRESSHLDIIRMDDFYKIVEWEGDRIEATSVGLCRISSLKLNFKTKEFFTITTDTGTCPEVPKLKKPRICEIVNGKEIISKELAKIGKKPADILAHDFQKIVNKLLTKEKAELFLRKSSTSRLGR